jgi:hypothetical protein
MSTITTTEKRKNHTTIVAADKQAEGNDPINDDDANRLPFIVRLRPDTLVLVDRAARRLNLSRSSFVASIVAERVTIP